jgi:hypothetical protein
MKKARKTSRPKAARKAKKAKPPRKSAAKSGRKSAAPAKAKRRRRAKKTPHPINPYFSADVKLGHGSDGVRPLVEIRGGGGGIFPAAPRSED